MVSRNDISQLWNLDGKHALVTGAGGGIGEGIAHMLAAAGAHVTVCDLKEEGAKKVAADIGGTAAVADLTSEDQVTALINDMAKIDIVVNNAGILRSVSTMTAPGAMLFTRMLWGARSTASDRVN